MTISTTNPATGEQLERFTPATPAEIEATLERAHAAAAVLRRESFAQRAEWARAAADILREELDETARLITLEMGKPIAQARAEVLKCAKSLDFYAEHAERFLAPDVLAEPTTVNASQARTIYQPLCPVLAVMPWNYPLWQVVRFAAPTLMAGNPGLLKHASNVPQCAMYLGTLFERAGFPTGSFQTLLIESGAVGDIVADPRIKAVTLTGSEEAGKAVASRAAASIKKSVLELGGSDPFIVMPSADIEAAAETAVRARTSNNGQSCIAAKRFIVHEEVYDHFTSSFTRRMAELSVGDPFDESTDIGPVASEGALAELLGLIDDAIESGATVLTGGGRIDRPGSFLQPTVLGDVSPATRLYTEETFGPVAVLYRAADLDEALAIANATRFGLSSAVWTDDDEEKERAIRDLDAGAVFINGMTVSYPELPFGGVKDSGYGRELAAAGIREFCNLKTVWEA